MKNIVILTGAGISAESGLKTFRDENGLWEGHDVMDVASPQGWNKDPKNVLEFYNQRRRHLQQVEPNVAHLALKDLEKKYNVQIITQNIDDLHERAGSKNVLHLHGELLKVRSTFDEELIMDWKNDLNIGDFCEFNHQLRPHVVWFGEAVNTLPQAIKLVEKAEFLLIIGTSMQVYPAAGLIECVSRGTPIYFIDPKPTVNSDYNLEVIPKKATQGVPELVSRLLASA